MSQRVPVHHLTAPRNLPMIEEEGLRTRGELSSIHGELDELDAAARGRFSHGKRVSAWLSQDEAQRRVDEYGPGLVVWEVDPRRAVAAPASLRAETDGAGYWQATRPLSEWLAQDDVPEDLEVHVDRGVRAKFVQLRAPLVTDEQLGEWAPLVHEVADEDRMSAKALMHLAVIASDGDFESEAFTAACALAWRDEPDDDELIAELLQADPDKVASAALAMYGASAPEATAVLREQLEATRVWAEENGQEPGQAVLMRTAIVLDQLGQ